MDTMCTNKGYTNEVYKREPEKSRPDSGRIANHWARASQPKCPQQAGLDFVFLGFA